MPNRVFEALFLLSFFLPPAAVLAGLLLLVLPTRRVSAAPLSKAASNDRSHLSAA